MCDAGLQMLSMLPRWQLAEVVMSAHDHSREDGATQESFLKSAAGLVLIGFLAIAAFFLITEHTAHFFGALPWLLLAACPLMHLFMHHGHGGHSGHGDSASRGGRQ